MAEPRPSAKRPRLHTDVSVPCRRWTGILPDAEKLCRRAAAAAFASSSGSAAEASIVLADDAFVRGLNLEYRDRDQATNVLSFPALDGDSPAWPADAPRMLGDVVVAFETAAREAADEDKTLGDHLCHLVVHGMLHLLGHDHETTTAAAEMERLEIDVLAGLDIADPYRGRPLAVET